MGFYDWLADLFSALPMLLSLASGGLILWWIWSAYSGKKIPATENRPKERLCEHCGYDLRASKRRCPECGTSFYDRQKYLQSLTNDWPNSPIDLRQPGLEERPERLVNTGNWIEADLLRQQLVARGIPSSIGNATIAPVAAYRQQMVSFDVMVYSGDLPAAKEYLQRVRNSDEEKAAE